MAPASALITLRRGPIECDISPVCGGSITRLDLLRDDGPVHLMRPSHPSALLPCSPNDLSCFPLVPFSNRIAAGHFRFHDHEVQLPLNRPPMPHPIHGHGWQTPWQASNRGEDHVLLTYRHTADAWLWPYEATQHFRLTETGLTVTLTLANLGSEPMPAGLGLHPYFPKPPGTVLTAKLNGVWLGSETLIPTEKVTLPAAWDFPQGIAMDDTVLDNNFAGWDGIAIIHWTKSGLGLRIEATEPFRQLVIYAPNGQDYFCVEPVSHMIDAVNRAGVDNVETGLQTIEPGGALSGDISFTLT
jgi:aldose 1-epimerase